MVKTNRRIWQLATQETSAKPALNQLNEKTITSTSNNLEVAPQVEEEKVKISANENDVKAVFEIFDTESKEEKKVKFADI